MLVEIAMLSLGLQGSGFYYIAPNEKNSMSTLYRIDSGIKVWSFSTRLIKTSANINNLDLVFQGCEPNAVISCEVIVFNLETGKIINDSVGILSKLGVDYVISSDSITNEPGPYDTYLISDSVYTKSGTLTFRGIIKRRDECGSFNIVDLTLVGGKEIYHLKDDCEDWLKTATKE